MTGLISLVAGLAAGGPLGDAFVALAIVLPGLLLQDAWRFAFFAKGEGKKAFVNDCVWGVALLPALYVAAHVHTVVAFVLAWGLSGAVAAALRLVPDRASSRTPARRWAGSGSNAT